MRLAITIAQSHLAAARLPAYLLLRCDPTTARAAATAAAELHAVLAFLGQDPPDDLSGASVAECWRWIRANWRSERLPRARTMIVS